jgi:hypothetical protein
VILRFVPFSTQRSSGRGSAKLLAAAMRGPLDTVRSPARLRCATWMPQIRSAPHQERPSGPPGPLARSARAQLSQIPKMFRVRRYRPAMVEIKPRQSSARQIPAEPAEVRGSGAVPQTALILVVTWRYGSGLLLYFAAHSPEDSQRDRKCCYARIQWTVPKGLPQYISADLC